MIGKKIFDIFNNTPTIRLAVVGATGNGKTYLLTDMVGAMEKLGYRRDDSFKDAVLHRDVYHLTENRGDDGRVDKTAVPAAPKWYIPHSSSTHMGDMCKWNLPTYQARQ